MLRSSSLSSWPILLKCCRNRKPDLVALHAIHDQIRHASFGRHHKARHQGRAASALAASSPPPQYTPAGGGSAVGRLRGTPRSPSWDSASALSAQGHRKYPSSVLTTKAMRRTHPAQPGRISRDSESAWRTLSVHRAGEARWRASAPVSRPAAPRRAPPRRQASPPLALRSPGPVTARAQRPPDIRGVSRLPGPMSPQRPTPPPCSDRPAAAHGGLRLTPPVAARRRL